MRIVTLAAALALAACDGTASPAVEAEYRAHLAVKARLRDPSSAEFGTMRVGSGITCGTVNARNVFGGMAGPQRFIVHGDAALLESDPISDFDAAWTKGCPR